MTALDFITLDTVEPLGCLVFFPDVNLKLGPQDLELYCVPVTYKETPDGGFTNALVLEPTHAANGQVRRVRITLNVCMKQAEILKNTGSLGITEFEDFDGSQYTISII